MYGGPCRTFGPVGSLRFCFTRFFRLLFAGAGLAWVAGSAPAAEHPRVAVAAAANLVYALDELHRAFRAAEPDIELTVSTGASGSLVAQITHGAPYDVFLSADLEYPRALLAAGHAKPDSLIVFAQGRLVVWTLNPALALDSFATLDWNAVKKIAIANTDSAPYGRAARSALERAGLWSQLSPKLVYGENVSQTAQFVETGSADLGFVALSLVLSPRLKERGRWLAVPPDLYSPLAQGAVLTRRGAANPAAARYLQFLQSEPAQAVLSRFGYEVPRRPVSGRAEVRDWTLGRQ
ncbi:molybdenum ABC transporter, periplasmic molybdate-binding protein [Opitutus terrae PB90-1]|uniref:Molybdenum ABC transporter, periplasmic molybdate-binding protein n=1 Tax=Opitutus terrae (strain DSM 11246 / JCM 15787 / PB90-1) TaxID=452637 RepID=B1ZVQ9_OPITP|nr:molybdenum ABC transporter, periplasmic molybdate-binding protein [Opitutus terrae PB90-1]